jgi:DNA-binding PadR family transcriptional regulator
MTHEAWFPFWWKAHKMGRHFGRRAWRHGFGWGAGTWQWGPERRVRRGDMKYRILELLAERPRHGYDIIRDLEEKHEGYRASAGSVYPTLQMLEDGSYVTGETVDGKRIYTITAAGRELLTQRTPDIDEDEDDDDEDVRAPWAAFKASMVQLGAAVMQLARERDAEKVSKASEVLDKARREIYKILADG